MALRYRGTRCTLALGCSLLSVALISLVGPPLDEPRRCPGQRLLGDDPERRGLSIHFSQRLLVEGDLIVEVEPLRNLSPRRLGRIQQLRCDGLLPDILHGLVFVLSKNLIVGEFRRGVALDPC